MPRALNFGACLAINVIVAALGSPCPLAAQTHLSANGDGGPALAATINGPGGLAIDEDGSVFVVERSGFRVRRIDPKTGVITTVAGNGKQCCFDENLPAVESALHYPVAVSIDHEHNLYIGDTLARIKRVDATSGLMSTVVRQNLTSHASDPGKAPSFDDAEQVEGLAIDPKDSASVIYAVGGLGHIYKIRDGSITIMPVFDRSASITNPQIGPHMDPVGVAVDAAGNIFVADYQYCRIMRVESGTSDLSVVAGTGECKTSGDGGSARFASFEHPAAIAIHANGDVYFASRDTRSCIRRIDHKTGLIKGIPGTCETKPGKQGPPSGLAVDSRGNIYFTLWGSNLVRKIDGETGQITTLAGNGLPDRRDFAQ